MRKPKVQNKYHLKPKDIEKAIILDEKKLHKVPFWRNNVIGAWCLNGGVGKGYYGCSLNSYWIGFYDKNAKSYAGKIRLECTAYEDMCSYKFKEFFNPDEIENEWDLQLQEALLEKINWMIDEGIIEIPKE